MSAPTYRYATINRGERVRLSTTQIEQLRALRARVVTEEATEHGGQSCYRRSNREATGEEILEEIADAKSAWVVGYWAPGNVSRRRYPSTGAAIVAARELMAGTSTKKWNPNGPLVVAEGGQRSWRVLGPNS